MLQDVLSKVSPLWLVIKFNDKINFILSGFDWILNKGWVLRVQGTLGTCFCVLWHATHVYVVVRNPLTLVRGLSAPISVYYSERRTMTRIFKISSINLALTYVYYHKFYICLLFITTWYSLSFCTFYTQALFLLAFLITTWYSLSFCTFYTQALFLLFNVVFL